jgi:hypothetical protein
LLFVLKSHVWHCDFVDKKCDFKSINCLELCFLKIGDLKTQKICVFKSHVNICFLKMHNFKN